MKISPCMENIPQKTKRRERSIAAQYPLSFKGSAETIITSWRDKALMSVFSQHYGNIGDRAGEKLYKLTSESEILQKSSRFAYKNGALYFIDKKAGRSLLEHIVFPFINLPLNAASMLLKKAQNFSSLKEGARTLYNKPFFRVSRKLNELDSKTDILKGIFEKTNNTVKAFAKEKGMEPDKLLAIISAPEKHPEDAKLIEEAYRYIKEDLYKAGSKFFDTHTGNFNTAYERPLNRIITGIIPVAFLANDAYNLSVLCGDSPAESKKEADARKKQELIRIFTTAYIQLMIFGAFTKQVNTIPWFAPVTSAATVLVSEIFSRRKLNRPVFFLTKEKAQEYNRKLNAEKSKKQKEIKEVKAEPKPAVMLVKKQAGVNYAGAYGSSGVFKDFEAASLNAGASSFGAADKKKTEKGKGRANALINFKTFKKGVIILTSSFLALSFLKNSSLTKNSKAVKGISNFFASIKEKLYDPLAYKDFEMSEKKFKSITGALKLSDPEKLSGSEKIAEGHEFIKGMYAKQTSGGMFKMFKSVLSSSAAEIVINTSAAKAQEINPALAQKEKDIIAQAVTTALKLTKTEIAEKKYHAAGRKALEIIKNKKVNLNAQQAAALEKEITLAVESSAVSVPVKIESKLKPFVDIVTEPFKFLYSAAKLPFKLLNSVVNMLTGSIQKKAAQAALGRAELNGFEKAVNTAVREIFGEKEAKTGKISQIVFANAMEKLEDETKPFRLALEALQKARTEGAAASEINKLQKALEAEGKKLSFYADTAAAKSFNGITQSSNKNTDLALMSKLASSAVTTAFLIADNYNMVMLKTNGEDKENAKEKANERIIQRLSGLFYQALFINWFNAVFRSRYNSSLLGMASVAAPNTLTTEILTRKSIGMPVGRKTLEELNQIDAENENKKGLAGKYFKFMRLLTGKKPLKERLPKQKQALSAAQNNTSAHVIQKKSAENYPSKIFEKFSKV